MKTQNLIAAILLAQLFFACQKEENLTPTGDLPTPKNSTQPVATTPNSPPSSPEIGGPSKPTYYRRYNPNSGYCIYLPDNCLPDVIILGTTICQQLDLAIAGGSEQVALLFTDETFSVSFIPTWNKEEFSEARAAILSGNYTFIKKESSTGLFYFLGEKSELTLEHYDLVFPVVIK